MHTVWRCTYCHCFNRATSPTVYASRACGICGKVTMPRPNHICDAHVQGEPMSETDAAAGGSHLAATVGPYSFRDLVRAIERDDRALQSPLTGQERQAVLDNLVLSARALDHLLAVHVIPGAVRALAQVADYPRTAILDVQQPRA